MILSFTCKGQEPKNIQARVFEVVKVNGRAVECKALSMQKDSIYFRKVFRLAKSVRKLQVGTWVTIEGYYTDEKGIWYYRKILINN